MKKAIESFNGVVRFSFKESMTSLEMNKKKESLIFLHFSYGGNRFKYSTGYKSCLEDWDLDKQRIKESKSKIINSREVNEFLSNIENVIKKEFSRLQAEQLIISNDLLKSFLDNYLNKNVPLEKSKPIEFFNFSETFLETKNKTSIITLRQYKQTLKKVKNYSLYSGEKVNFNTFEKHFVINFINYLESLDYALNTISKHLKNLKMFLKEAERKKLITNVNFNIADFNFKPEQTTAIYLTDEEIKAMFNKDLSKYKELEFARDVFLIGCYTGQRVSDYNGLSNDSIKNINGVEYFVIKQKKTKSVVQCPITKEIKEIMDKRHNGIPPRKILEKDLNKNIKEVGQILKFNQKVEYSITKGGVEKKEFIPKYKLIHSHSARRSFCTNMYKKGMSAFDIMHFSGHKTEREFYKYIRIVGEERASHIVEQGFFNI